MKVAFLILNYRTADLTKQCVDKLLRLEGANQFDIYIVNNDDRIDDFYILEQCYKNNIHIFVAHTSCNLGFSKGNNWGYDRIRSANDIYDFLVVLNSDVFIDQNEFVNLLYDEYRRKSFYICGPDVYVPRVCVHANPLRYEYLQSNTLYDEIHHLDYISLSDIIKTFMMNLGGYRIYARIISALRPRKYNVWKKEIDDVVLNGCCMIFSREFMNINKKLFDPETFMYYEEDIMAFRCKRNGWKTRYIPRIHVVHLAGKSGKNSLFRIKRELIRKKEVKKKALTIYKDFMNKEINECYENNNKQEISYTI